jgi:LemA protein
VRRVVPNGVVGDARRQLGAVRVASVALLVAAAVVWMSLWLVQTWTTRSTPTHSAMVLPRDPVRTAVVVAACSLAFAAAAAVISRRNRLVALRNQIEYAAGVIEVAAQQRHDLIRSLLGVVRLGATHETAVQSGVDLIRADGSDRDRLASVCEEHPASASDDLFAGLHTQLGHCEDRLAAARRFHNDAVTLARDRAGTFPTLLLRPVVFPRGIPPLLDFGLASVPPPPPPPPVP